jgi:hypothetical protein
MAAKARIKRRMVARNRALRIMKGSLRDERRFDPATG